MAAYASLVSLAQKLEQIHGDPTYVLHPHHQVFKPLLETVEQLQALMGNFPEATQEFEVRIADFANGADDSIDSIVSYLLNSQDSGGCDEAPKLSGNCNDFGSLYKNIHKLNDGASILVEAESLQVQGGVVGSANIQMNESSIHNPIRRVSRPIGKLSVVPVGFDEELGILKERLYGDSTQTEVIPIFGMGGLGKTTLATTLYEHSVSVRHFDIRGWITVSQNYDICQLLSKLLRDMRGSSPYDTTNYGKLGVEVFQTLKKRRYRIVIDDIWSENFWGQVKIWFPDDGNRSRIFLTTRLEDVASYATSGNSQNNIHKVKLMDLDRSWSLLKNKVFGEEDCPVELEGIGKAIAKDCGGLPLAIVVVAGILSGVDQNQNSWRKIARDVGTIIRKSDDNDQVMEILSLSYRHLPHHLKSCFLYLGVFPEDYEIHVSTLMMLWVAEGFIKKPIKNGRFEDDQAYEYLEDLVKKNLILISIKRSNGQIRWCRVHDLIRSLCVKTTQMEKFVHQIDCNNLELGIKNPRRVSICWDNFNCGGLDTTCIRSALYLICERSLPVFEWSFRLLRVMDAFEIEVSEFPSQVCQLFHLRYLAFTLLIKNDCKVPTSISKLQNLQVLKVRVTSTGGMLFLPFEIWEMQQLRHLVFPWYYTTLADPPFVGTSSLENLRILTGVYNFRCTNEVLQMIPNIRKLGIYYNRDRDGVPDDYCLHNLAHLLQLETMSILLCVPWENIRLPQSLKKLNLKYCRIPWAEIGSLIGWLPNLEVLKLRKDACYGESWETREGEFPKLKMLEINNKDLVTWTSGDDSSHIFPMLEHLCLYECCSLSEVPSCIGEIDTLMLIEIDKKNEFLVEWATELQEEQLSYGNELQIRIHLWSESDWISYATNEFIADESFNEQLSGVHQTN